MEDSLRFLTYLTPSYPAELFHDIAAFAAAAAGRRPVVDIETRWSGPPPNEPDPFSTGSADVGFICSPSYLRLTEDSPPPVELLPAPVFAEPRNEGRPVYFCDVIVAATSPAHSVADLEGATWAYNDTESLSGYWSMLAVLDETDLGREFLGEARQSGSHLASIQAVASDVVATAVIDGNVWPTVAPELRHRIRTIATVGPFPAQPIVVRTSLTEGVRTALATALLEAGDRFAAHGVVGFAHQDPTLYAAERQLLTHLRSR